MTSSEFAARYRLLKNVATRGARSFLAQQVELGRMVMVHYLDAESVDRQADMLARLQQLRGSGRSKLLEIADVDGTPVAVTLFLTSFVDFAAWLDQVSPASELPVSGPPTPVPGDFTRAFSKLETPATLTPPPAPARAPEAPVTREAAPARAPSEFTQFFGKSDFAAPPTAEPAADIVDAPTLIMKPVKTPVKAPVKDTPMVPPPPVFEAPDRALPAAPPPPPGDSSSGFTAIFGRMPDAPSFAAPGPPPAPPSSPAIAPPIDASPEPGEFTQLFQRLAPTGATPPRTFAAPVLPVPSLLVNNARRPSDVPPRADLMPPTLNPPAALNLPPAPSFGLPPVPVPSLGSVSPPGPPSPPRFADVSAPPNGDALFNGGIESEFTRILGRVPLQAPPPIAIEPPSPSPSTAAPKPGKSMMPLILALNVVVLLTIAIVAYFVLKR